MVINQVFELSMILDIERFKEAFSRVYNKGNYLKALDDEFIDTSLATKGITVIYRDSRYKKKVRILINASLIVDDLSDTGKLIRKLDKRIAKYFASQYRIDDFTLSGMTLVSDIDVGGRENVTNYLKVIQRVGKVKGFSPVSYDFLDDVDSFCLSGNSNNTDFLLYDMKAAVMGQMMRADTGRKELNTISSQVGNILRAEVRLTKPKAIQVYTNSDSVHCQIEELSEKRQKIFMDTFARIVPFGDFHKKDAAIEIIRNEVTDSIMRRRMLRLMPLIPEKKSLHLAQKAINSRDVEKVMEAFAKINLSPVTISKRHEVKHLDNLYSYFL